MDSHYLNSKLAKLYDLDSGWNIERDFYMSLAGESPKSILDLGCGTGLICDALSRKGHDVTGADPAAAMLAVAKNKPHAFRVKWVQSKAQNFKADKKFDLIIITGNAFQVFLDDEDIKSVFQVMSDHLKVEVYDFKQKLMKIILTRVSVKAQARRIIPQFLDAIRALKMSKFKNLETLGNTLEEWSEEIVRMWRFSKTNSITEGLHRRMDEIQNRTYGMHNFNYYRLRVKAYCG